MARGPLRVTRAGRVLRLGRPGPDTLDFLFGKINISRRRVMEEIAPLAARFERRLESAVARWMVLTPWQRRFVTLDDRRRDAA